MLPVARSWITKCSAASAFSTLLITYAVVCAVVTPPVPGRVPGLATAITATAVAAAGRPAARRDLRGGGGRAGSPPHAGWPLPLRGAPVQALAEQFPHTPFHDRPPISLSPVPPPPWVPRACPLSCAGAVPASSRS